MNPAEGSIVYTQAMTLFYAGAYETAVPIFEHSIEANAEDPLYFLFYEGLAEAQYGLGNCAAVFDAARRSQALKGGMIPVELLLTASSPHLGLRDVAYDTIRVTTGRSRDLASRVFGHIRDRPAISGRSAMTCIRPTSLSDLPALSRLPSRRHRRMLASTGEQGLGEMTDGLIEIRAEATGFVAEISGVDLVGKLSEADFEQIRAAIIRHKVLVFRDQRLDDNSHYAFAQRFGPLEGHVNRSTRLDALPKLQVFGNLDVDGKTTGVHPEKGTLVWHTDKSYIATPSLFTILRSPFVARTGGDTLFADMARAYEALEPAASIRLEGLRAVHDWKRSREKSDERPATADEIAAAPPVDHPLIRTHPETNARTIYIGNHASHILDWEIAAGEALLAQLEAHATQENFIYRHRWRENDVLMWDNRCTMHCVTAYDAAAERRVVHRAVVQGDRPY